MNLIKQEDTKGCGLACIAMIMGQSYEQTKAEFQQKDFNNNGLSEYEINDYLFDKGFAVRAHRQNRIYSSQRVDLFKVPLSKMSIVMVKQPSNNYHYVVRIGDGRIFDPLGAEIDDVSHYPEIMAIFDYFLIVRES